jgi:hypothetical protein
LVAALLALGLGPSGGLAAELTSIDVQDPAGLAVDAKVTVADAATGLLVASGRTDTTTGRFSFSSLPGAQFVVVVNTAAGYVGSHRVGSGEVASIYADTTVEALPKTTYSGTLVTLGTSQAASGLRVAIVAWSTFQPIDRGTTDQNGLFQVQVPSSLGGLNLLGILWDDNQIWLQGLQSLDPPLELDGNEGFESF